MANKKKETAMLDMSTGEKGLESLVGKVKAAGYTEKGDTYVDHMRWFIYTKDTEKVARAVYVSNGLEMFSIETFPKVKCYNEVERALEVIVGSYKKVQERIGRIKENERKYTWGATVGTALAFGAFTRKLLGLAIGAVLGYFGARVIIKDVINGYNERLQEYFDKHHVAVGKDAMKKLYRERAQKT